MVKPYTTIDNQIDLLIKRGLIIEDKEFAKYLLSRISYYRLSSYRFPIFDKNTDSYLDGYNIKYLQRYHNIDAQYKTYLYYILQFIEVTFRTLLVNNLSQTDPYFYTKENNFDFGETRGSQEEKSNALKRKEQFFNKIKKTINNTNNVHIDFYKERHDKEVSKNVLNHQCNYRKNNCNILYKNCDCIPESWIAFESFDFGQLIEIYSKLRGDLFQNKKDKIANFFCTSYKDLLNMLEDIKRIRNIIAHHDKIINRYSYKKSTSVKFLRRHYQNNLKVSQILIKTKKKMYERTFLPYFLVIKYFLDVMFANEFSSEFKEIELINNYLIMSNSDFYKKLLSLEELDNSIFKLNKISTFFHAP